MNSLRGKVSEYFKGYNFYHVQSLHFVVNVGSCLVLSWIGVKSDSGVKGYDVLKRKMVNKLIVSFIEM